MKHYLYCSDAFWILLKDKNNMILVSVPKTVEEITAVARSSDSMELSWVPPGDSYYEQIKINYKGTLKQDSLDWQSVGLAHYIALSCQNTILKLGTID